MSFKVFLSKSYHQSVRENFWGSEAWRYFQKVIVPAARTMQDCDCSVFDYVNLVLTATMDMPDVKSRNIARRDLWHYLKIAFFVPDNAGSWDKWLTSALNQKRLAEEPVFTVPCQHERAVDTRNSGDRRMVRHYRFETFSAVATIWGCAQVKEHNRAVFNLHVVGKGIDRWFCLYSAYGARAMWKQADRAVLQTIAEYGRFPLCGK